MSASLDGIVNLWRHSSNDSHLKSAAHNRESKDLDDGASRRAGNGGACAMPTSSSREEDAQNALQKAASNSNSNSNSSDDSACTTVCSWWSAHSSDDRTSTHKLGEEDEGRGDNLTINYGRGEEGHSVNSGCDHVHVTGVIQNHTSTAHTWYKCGADLRMGYEDIRTCANSDSDSDSWSLEQSFTAPEAVHSVAFSPDQKHIACCCLDKTIIVRCLQSRNTCCVLQGHQQSVLCCAWSRDGAYLASGGEDMSVRVWHVHTGRQVMRRPKCMLCMYNIHTEQCLHN